MNDDLFKPEVVKQINDTGFLREDDEQEDDGFMDFVSDNIKELKDDFLEEQEDLWFKFKKDEYNKWREDRK